MSAVEVPPCSLETEQEAMNIRVNDSYGAQPIILSEEGMQEYQNYISELECKERKLGLEQETIGENDQDERENMSTTFGGNEEELVKEETAEDKCLQEDRESSDDILEDFRRLINKNNNASVEFECVISEDEGTAWVSGTPKELVEENSPFGGESRLIIADSGLSLEFDELDSVNVSFSDNNAMANGDPVAFNEQDAVRIPSGDKHNIVIDKRTSQELDEQDDEYIPSDEDHVITDSANVCNNMNTSMVNQTDSHPTDSLNPHHHIASDAISEKIQEDKNKKKDDDCKDDDIPDTEYQDSRECEGEESDPRTRTLSESEEDEIERLRVLDSLRAEYINKVWDEYIYEFLIASGHVTQAAIVDIETGLILAGSFDFNILDSEFQQILFGIQYAEVAYRNGVTVNGCNYKVRLADGRHGIFAKSGPCGCSVCKTDTLVIIGVHDGSCDPRRCNEEVMRLGDFFTNKGM